MRFRIVRESLNRAHSNASPNGGRERAFSFVRSGSGSRTRDAFVGCFDQAMGAVIKADASTLLVHDIAEREAGFGIGEADGAAHAGVTEGGLRNEDAVLFAGTPGTIVDALP